MNQLYINPLNILIEIILIKFIIIFIIKIDSYTYFDTRFTNSYTLLYIKEIHYYIIMVVNIKEKAVELKYSFRSFIIYENITGESFRPSGKLTEFITFFYSTIMASDKNLPLEFNDFLNWLDENPTQLDEFIKWLSNSVTSNKMMTPNSDGSEEGSESKN